MSFLCSPELWFRVPLWECNLPSSRVLPYSGKRGKGNVKITQNLFQTLNLPFSWFTTQIIMKVCVTTPTYPHLELDILECEVRWALGSITTNKASGGNGIPVKLFQILKDDAVKVLHSICQQIGKLSSGHRTGKGQFSFQSQRKAMPNMLKLPHNCTHLTC